MLLNKFSVLLGLLVIIGCQKNEPPAKVDPDLIRFNLKTPLRITNQGALSPEKLEFLNRVSRNQEVSFSKLTQYWVESHEIYYRDVKKKNFPGSLTPRISNLSSKADAGLVIKNDFPNFKFNLERALQEDIGQRAGYFYEADSLPEIFLDKNLQCYSGTVLYTVANRMRFFGIDYLNQKQLVLFQNGHVLPGYWVGQNNDRQIFGLEMTLSSKALVRLGRPSEMKIATLAVDANDFAFFETFKNFLLNRTEVATEMQNKVEKMLQIPSVVRQTAQKANAIGIVKPSQEELQKISRTSFGFGKPKPPPTPVARESADEIDPGKAEGIGEKLEIDWKAYKEPTEASLLEGSWEVSKNSVIKDKNLAALFAPKTLLIFKGPQLTIDKKVAEVFMVNSRQLILSFPDQKIPLFFTENNQNSYSLLLHSGEEIILERVRR